MATTPVLTALADLSWVEALASMNRGRLALIVNEPTGLTLRVREADGFSAPIPLGGPVVGTALAVLGDRVACCVRDESGEPRLVVWDGVARFPRMGALAEPHRIAWSGEDLIVVERGSPRRLVAVPADGSGLPRVLAELEDGGDPAPSAGQAGRVLYADRRAHRVDLCSVDLTTGARSVVLRGERGAEPRQAVWAPDGGRVVCTVRRQRRTEAVVLDFRSGVMTTLRTPPLLAPPVWTPDGGGLVLTVDDWPATRLARYDLETGILRSVPLPAGLMGGSPVWGNGSCHFLGYAPGRPPALWQWDPVSGRTTQADTSPDWPQVPSPHVTRCPADGYELPALVYEPEVRRPDRAVAVFLHGGPAATWRAGWDPVVHAFIEAGFRVVLAETRGGSFTAWPLPALPLAEHGEGDVDDVGTIVAAVSGGAPVVVHGHSFGALLAYRASLRHPAVRALVLTSGALDPGALEGAADPAVGRFRRRAFPSARPSGDSLPSSCPILLVHGQHDAQVPVEVARDTIRRLSGAGHRLEELAGEGHAFGGRDNVVQWIGTARRFAEQAIEEAS